MRNAKIKALKIEPMMPPMIFYIEPTMRALKKAVNADHIKYGGVEAKKLENQVYLVFNKDRFLVDGNKPNRRIADDIISGNILVVAVNDNRIPISLSDEQISKYALRFWDAETFDDIDVMEANLNTMFSRFLKDEEL